MHEQRRKPVDARLQFVAPLDRAVFYPVAQAVYRVIGRLPVTPNQISVLHLMVGVSTFWWLAAPSGSHPVAAFGFYMVRNVLDCLDGVVARAKGLVSPMGRILDEWSDACSAVALVSGTAVAAWRVSPAPWIPALAVLALASAAALALQHELFRRRIIVAVETGRDCVGIDYAAARRQRFTGIGAWLGYVAETVKVRLAAANPAAKDTDLEAEARFLQQEADSREQRRVLRVVRFGGGDHPVIALLMCALMEQYVAGLVAMTVYGLVFSILVGVVMTRHLARRRG